ncbi:TetR/AcrR family transcriptional regulator [soil metagenome]
MLADGTAATASIQEITAAADVGFGSFYNHFDGKPALFEAAAEQVFEQWGEQLDRWETASDDPAEVCAAAFRRSGILLVTHSEEAKLIAYSGFHLLDSDIGLAPRARRDLGRAMDTGRFTFGDVDLAMAKTAGYLFALLHTWLRTPDKVGADQVDEAAEELLRIFGLKPAEARRIAHRPLEGVDELAFW